MIFEGYDISKYLNYIDEIKNLPTSEGTIYHIHHIIPKCMGGSNDAINLVKLCPEHHFKAHLILAESFPDGHKIKAKNLSSCRILCRGIKHQIKKSTGIDVEPVNLQFWEMANKILSSSLRGKNHPSFGTKLTQEQREVMSKNRVGNKNKFFGKKHKDETKKIISLANKGNKYALGSIRSEVTRKKMSEKQKEFQVKKGKVQLPDGVYYCDEIINDKKKTVYRFCPICNKKLYHLLRADAVRFHKKGMSCYECSIILKKSKRSEETKNGD